MIRNNPGRPVSELKRWMTALAVGIALLCNGAITAQTTTFNIADGDVAGLIAAIQIANANCDTATTINLAPGGTYILTAVAENPPEYNGPGAVGLPVIRVSVTINGHGATIQRSTASGTPSFVPLAVSGRTAAGPPACYADPVLTLNQTVLTGGSQGGLHINSAAAVVQASTITQNTGGGINNACGALTLLNSTVSYNTSDSAWGGGGVFLWDFSCAPDKPIADISFSTIYENSNPGWGRGNAIGIGGNVGSGRIRLKNSILASPSHPSEAVCNSGNNILTSLGHNILGDAAQVFGSSCPAALTAPGDLVNTNPLLGPLASNGGPTPTHLPLVGSPAVDAVPIADCTDVFGVAVTIDQRGVARPAGPACDVGSVEADAADTTPPVIHELATSSPALWPADHRMVAITVTAAATDDVSAEVATRILSVTSNEPDDGLGDGDIRGDIEITGAMTLKLRAERSGRGSGRVYTITVEGADEAGNTTTKSIHVVVPHSRRK